MPQLFGNFALEEALEAGIAQLPRAPECELQVALGLREQEPQTLEIGCHRMRRQPSAASELRQWMLQHVSRPSLNELAQTHTQGCHSSLRNVEKNENKVRRWPADAFDCAFNPCSQ